MRKEGRTKYEQKIQHGHGARFERDDVRCVRRVRREGTSAGADGADLCGRRGANAHFNSTPSMEYDKYANPYPYNTLEKLAKEWNEQNTGYEIVIARSSLNNDRETMVPALNQGTAPEILFYLGTTIAEDMSKGWFVELNDYMKSPINTARKGKRERQMEGHLRQRRIRHDAGSQRQKVYGGSGNQPHRASSIIRRCSHRRELRKRPKRSTTS